jgi:hypothetical protein
MEFGTIPLVILVGETTKVPPLQITVLIGVISGVGFTNTVKVNEVFSPQFTLVGRIVYTAVCVVLTPLRRLPEIYDNKLPVPPLVTVNEPFDTKGLVHVYNVFAGTIPFLIFVGLTSNDAPLHIVVLISVITAFGFTNTTTVNVAPTQLPGAGAVGVTVYTAVRVVFVLLVKLPVTNKPLPL